MLLVNSVITWKKSDDSENNNLLADFDFDWISLFFDKYFYADLMTVNLYEKYMQMAFQQTGKRRVLILKTFACNSPL